MATATTTDDELLIIEDDDTPDLNNIKIEQEEPTNENIIDFWETEILKEKPEIKKEESNLDLNFDLGWEKDNITVEDIFWEKEEKKSEPEITEKINKIQENDIDFSFDLWEEKSEKNKQEEIKIEESKEEIKDTNTENNIEMNFDLEPEKIEEKTEENIISEDAFSVWDTTTNISSATIWTVIWWDDSSTWDDDINSILDETIKKLKARKESIEKIKTETSAKIEKLQKEIKALQAEVKEHKSEIKEFDKETSKIEENIESLEKMKMK